MDAAVASAIAAIISVIISTIVLSITGTWKISAAKEDILTRININSKETDQDFQVIRHEFGETVGAIREKITQVELYVRDNYVRRDSFYQAIDGLKDHVDVAITRLEAQIARLEIKIDKVTNAK